MGSNELTALHIAAYKGNVQAIKKLIASGANPRIESKHGMTVMHCAAQNDKPWPIVYFKEEHHMDVDTPDHDGNTPLHWAANCGAVYAASYLLKWTAHVNAHNGLSETPLHLAVNASLASGACRLVRLLCFHGADRKATDGKGRSPADYLVDAESHYPEDTIAELGHVLAEPTECLCLMLKVPIKQMQRSMRLLVDFFFFQIIHKVMLQLIAIPRLPGLLGDRSSGSTVEFWASWANFGLFAISTTLFLTSALLDPGRHKKSRKHKLIVLSGISADPV